MRIALAADHNGGELAQHLSTQLRTAGHDIDDRGTRHRTTVDYPALCVDVCRAVTGGGAERGIVLGGTGSGEQMACNKIAGIRASLCHRELLAEVARAHNDANVLVMGAKIVTPELAERILEVWLTTPFKGGRHQRRLDQIAAIERGEGLA